MTLRLMRTNGDFSTLLENKTFKEIYEYIDGVYDLVSVSNNIVTVKNNSAGIEYLKTLGLCF